MIGLQSVWTDDSKLLQESNLTAGVAWYSVPLKVVREYQLIDPLDHNMPFEMIPLKLKVDTKHRLLMLNTCNVGEYFSQLPRTSAIYLHRPRLLSSYAPHETNWKRPCSECPPDSPKEPLNDTTQITTTLHLHVNKNIAQAAVLLHYQLCHCISINSTSL